MANNIKETIFEFADGSKFRWINGKYHRVDGPAIEYADGSKAWYINGKRHRIDGPAYESPNGVKSWWIKHICINTINDLVTIL